MALAQVAAVALVGGFAASSSGVAHEALFRLEMDLVGERPCFGLPGTSQRSCGSYEPALALPL